MLAGWDQVTAFSIHFDSIADEIRAFEEIGIRLPESVDGKEIAFAASRG